MTEIHWLAATCLMTGIFWMVYVMNRFVVVGIAGTLGNPSPDHPPLSPWAQRALAAHKNATENLVLFGPLAVGVVVLEVSSELTVTMAMLYFYARLAHFVVYTAGIALARTLAFAAAWIAILVLALTILGVI